MDLLSSQRSKMPAEEESRSLLALYIHFSNDSNEKDMLIRVREILEEEALNGNITSSQSQEEKCSVMLMNSFIVCKTEDSETDCTNERLLEEARQASTFMKIAASIFLQLGVDEKAAFQQTLELRRAMTAKEYYPSRGMFWWDVGVVVDLLLRHISDRLSSAFKINLHSHK